MKITAGVATSVLLLSFFAATTSHGEPTGGRRSAAAAAASVIKSGDRILLKAQAESLSPVLETEDAVIYDVNATNVSLFQGVKRARQLRSLLGGGSGIGKAVNHKRADDREGDRVHSSIAYGHHAKRGDFPYIAALLKNKGDWAFCGGSLIRPRVVVTAAHCVVEDDGSLSDVYAVGLGLVNREDFSTRGAEYRRVAKVVVHRSYDPDTYAYDIALLVLSKRAKSKPVPLATRNERVWPLGPKGDGDWLFVAGWGENERGDFPTDLMYAQVPFLSRTECNELLRDVHGLSRMPKTHICAGWGADLQDSCGGDSGGPLVKSTRFRDVLVGIVSYGPPDSCGEGAVGAYTSIMAMRPWIDKQIRALKG